MTIYNDISIYIYIYMYIYVAMNNLLVALEEVPYLYAFLVIPYLLDLCVLQTNRESRFCYPHDVIFYLSKHHHYQVPYDDTLP
jgi:hypothetical protein